MKIGVTDTGSGDKQLNYERWLNRLAPDAELILLSYSQKNANDVLQCDGLLLTGGVDVDPKFSLAEPVTLARTADRKRDEFEFSVIEYALKKEIPILGICRGLQVMNVFLGGTLIADLQSEGFQQHDAREDQQDIRHSVAVVKDSMLHTIIGSERGEINSHHHQAVKKIAAELRASSFSADGVVESLEWKQKDGKSFLFLAQWHPERMNDGENPFAETIGKEFVRTVKDNTV